MPSWLKTLLLVLTQIPLVTGLWTWLNQAKARPIFTLTVTALYEVSIFLFAFGRKVWDKLEDKAVQYTSDWILTGVRGFAPGFRRRYKKYVVNEHGVFNVRGLGLINTFTLSLDQVFVDLRIDPSNPQKFNIDPIAKKNLIGNRPIWDFLRIGKSTIPKATALAIIGPPGSGKTTLLQHIAMTLASNRQRRYKVRAYIPIFLFLRDHIKTITQENPPPLGKLSQDYFSDTSSFNTLKPPDNWFEKQLKRGKCMVLLDGLDEVADIEKRKAISIWVDNQIKDYPNSRFILSARPQGYMGAPLQRAHVLEVQPFNGHQVKKFIENWYLANEVMSSGGKNDLAVKQRARRDAHDLLQRLRRSPSLGALTVNPLLLTMIAMVHRYHGALPGSRVELYAEICEVLFGRWRQTRGVRDDKLKTAQKLVILRPLAAHMMESKLRDISTKAAMGIIAPPMKRVGITREEAKSFLGNLQASSGLILEREAERWSFAHHTFQEYLTASYWLTSRTRKHVWGAIVGDSWWHETLLLYAAQGDATPIVQACLQIDSVPTLTLAVECLDEARELNPNIREATVQRLIDDLESSNPARRRLAAEVQLNHRLKSLHRIDEGNQIDLEYLTCAEYQLFLDDMREQGNYFQPEHWADYNFVSGQALTPVSGVQAREANAFCEWLTRRQGGNIRYRLPLPSEARQFPARTDELATWCKDRDRYVLTGLAKEKEQVIREQLLALSTVSLPLMSSIALGQPLDLDLGLDFNIAHNFDTALANAVSFAPHHELTYRITHHLAYHLPLTHELNPSNSRHYARELALTITEAFDINHITKEIIDGRIDVAIQQAKELYIGSANMESRMSAILINVLTAANAQSGKAARQAQRRYIAQILDFIFAELKSIENYKKEIDSYLRSLLGIYWWLQIGISREEGNLPAWEGIRIVREQL
jgi:energy-coupling factor transporter ATP-binding protein EcfA2